MAHPTVLIATDGSDIAIEAANRALALLHPDARVVLVTVVDERHDPMEDAGGFEGPVVTDEEADAEWAESVQRGRAALERTEAALDAGTIVGERLIPSGEPLERAL